jgi:hypothetical protein
MDAVETLTVAPGGTVSVMLLSGLLIHALTVSGTLPLFVTVITLWSPDHCGEENTFCGAATWDRSVLAVGFGVGVAGVTEVGVYV